MESVSNQASKSIVNCKCIYFFCFHQFSKFILILLANSCISDFGKLLHLFNLFKDIFIYNIKYNDKNICKYNKLINYINIIKYNTKLIF